MPGIWADSNERHYAAWIRNYSIDKKGDFEVEWKARLDYEGKCSASDAFSKFSDESVMLFPIHKIKEGSDGDIQAR